jgi:hypothetical protein
MTNHDLEIIARLRDEVSKKLQGIEGGIIKFANRTREIGNTMKQLGRDMSQVGRNIAFLGAAITGPFLLAFRNAEKYSAAVHNQMERLKNITNAFQVQIATALVPIMERFTNILAGLLQAWNNLSPATQQMIVQGAFLSGVFLLLSGIATDLVGRLIRLPGIVANVAAKFMLFAVAHPYIAITIALITILIALMFRFKGVADVVLNSIEVLFLFFLNGLEAIRIAFSRILAFILGMIEKFFTKLSILPGKLGKVFKEVATQIKGMREELDKFGDQGLANLEKNTKKIQDIYSTGKGSLSESFDNVKTKIQEVWDLLTNPPKLDVKPLQEDFDYIGYIVDNTYQAIERTLSDTLFNSITQKSFKLVDFFRGLGNSLLRIWTDMLAKMITEWIKAQTAMQLTDWLKILGSILGFFGGGGGGGAPAPSGPAITLHSGGPVRRAYPVVRAHTGLGPNEIRAILRTDEGILSPTGMRALGEDNLSRLNQGKSIGSSIVLQPTIVIQAIDTQTGTEFILKRRKEVGQALVEEILKNNTLLRSTLAKYGKEYK